MFYSNNQSNVSTRAMINWGVLAILIIPAILRADDLEQSWPFLHPMDSFRQGALLDLRSLNETVAGQSGFVHLAPDGNGFVRGDGQPIRFWACGSGEYQKDAAELASHARFLAKIGVNMVRLHTQIAPTGDAPALTDVNQKEIDGIWRAVAAFRKEGIYVTISPYWATEKAAAKWEIPGYEKTTDLWGLLFFNETLQRGYKAWVKQLYAPVNPYTGIPLSRDPAVAVIEVQNEDGMFFWTMQSIQPEQKIILSQKFSRWLEKKYGSLSKALVAWDRFETTGDKLADGTVAIMLVWEWTQPQTGGKAKRLADQLEFFAQAQREFYAAMADYYHKDLGCGQLINASNWVTADSARLGDVERYTNTAADVLAVNRYFDGVHVGKNTGWRIDPGDYFQNKPAVLNPRELPTNLKQTAGHPMIITESSWVNPLDFQSEGPFLIAAYESLTGIAGYDWFTASAPQYDEEPYYTFLDLGGQHPFRKWTCSTPALMGNFPAAALLYRKGYLKQGGTVISEQRPLEDLWQRKTPVIAEDPTFDPNRNTGDRAAVASVAAAVDPLAFLVGPVRMNFGDGPPTKIADLSAFIDHGKKIIKSNTGQIQLDYNIGLCTIDSPAAQGASGFLKTAGAVNLSSITIDCQNEHASILVVSMDEKPLVESQKVLVQIGTRARPTGWKETPADFKGTEENSQYHGFKIENTGKMPFRIANGRGTLSVKNRVLSKAAVLDTSGYAAREWPMERSGATIKFTLPAEGMYLILQ